MVSRQMQVTVYPRDPCLRHREPLRRGDGGKGGATVPVGQSGKSGSCFPACGRQKLAEKASAFYILFLVCFSSTLRCCSMKLCQRQFRWASVLNNAERQDAWQCQVREKKVFIFNLLFFRVALLLLLLGQKGAV